MSYSSPNDTARNSQPSVLDQLDGSLLVRILQSVHETRTRAQLACVCKGWRVAVCDSWDTVKLSFMDKQELETQLSWLVKQLQGRPWLLHAIEFYCGKYLDPTSLDLHLARFSGLTSMNLISLSRSGHTEEDNEQGMHSIFRPNFTLRPEALEKLYCTSATLQKLCVAYTEDSEVVTLHAIKCDQKGVVSAQYLTLQHFSKFTNLQELHVILCRLYDNRFRPSVKLSASLTALRKLKALVLRNGSTINEEEPGLLSELSSHLTRLGLHCWRMGCEHISSSSLQSLSIMSPQTHRLPVGYCPDLRTLYHSARDVTAEDLLQLPKLTTLRDNLFGPNNLSSSFVMGLQPLSRLQHIHLSQYHAGLHGTFEEMSVLPQLQSFKVMIDNDPTHLSLSHDLSRISALHTIELRKSFTATHYAPVVFAEADFLTSLRSLTMECERVECVRSSSLEYLEMSGPGGYMMSDWPEVTDCLMLTVLKLHDMPAAMPRWLMAQFEALTLLQQLQITFAYTTRPHARVVLGPDRQTHSMWVNELLSTVQGLPALQALQLVALRADMVMDLGKARSEELRHLALACRAFRLLPAGGQSASDEAFQSMHVLTRDLQDAATLQYLEAREPSKCSSELLGVQAYKIGPPNVLDLDWMELVEDIRDGHQEVSSSDEESC